MNIIEFGFRQFAVKEHDATTRHWDLRLQYEGKLLLSYALNSPPNLNPNKPIRAAWTGYHQLEFLLAERIIQEGVKRPGPSANWDMGVYKTLGNRTISEQFASGHIRIFLVAQRLNGIYTLKHVGPRPGDWLWTKDWDYFVEVNKQFPTVLTPEKIRELEGAGRSKIGGNQISFI